MFERTKSTDGNGDVVVLGRPEGVPFNERSNPPREIGDKVCCGDSLQHVVVVNAAFERNDSA